MLFLVLFISINVLCGHILTFDIQIVGIYSICGSNFTQNELSFEGYRHNKSFLSGFQDFKEYSTMNNWNYNSFDICFDQNKFQNVMNLLLLDSAFYSEEETFTAKTFFGNYKLSAKKTSKILMIIAHVPGDYLELLLNLFSFTNIQISKFSENIETTSSMKSNKNFVDLDFSYDDVIEYIERKSIWDDVIIVNTEDNVYKETCSAQLCNFCATL